MPGCPSSAAFGWWVRWACGGAVGVALAASSARAQPGSTEPATTPPPAVVPVRPGDGPAPVVVTPPRQDPPQTMEPVRPNVPGSPAVELNLPVNPPLMREGAFIANARGQVVRGKTGRYYFIFDRDRTGRTLPPMVVEENANMAAMERLMDKSPAGTRLRIGGEVLAYRGHNYLLVTTPPMLERVDTSSASKQEPGPGAGEHADHSTPSNAEPHRLGKDPSVEEIITDMDRSIGNSLVHREGASPTQASPSSTAGRYHTKPGAGSPALPLPGTTHPVVPEIDARQATPSGIETTGYLASREGRLVRSFNGELVFQVDSGAEGASEPPMTILPCQNLEALENLFDASSDTLPVTLSGEVFIYKNRSYLLPSMYVVKRHDMTVLPTH